MSAKKNWSSILVAHRQLYLITEDIISNIVLLGRLWSQDECLNKASHGLSVVWKLTRNLKRKHINTKNKWKHFFYVMVQIQTFLVSFHAINSYSFNCFSKAILSLKCFHEHKLTLLWVWGYYLDNNTIVKSTMRVHQKNLGLAVIELEFHDLLMNLLLTVNLFRQSLLQSTVNKWWIMIVEPEINLVLWKYNVIKIVVCEVPVQVKRSFVEKSIVLTYKLPTHTLRAWNCLHYHDEYFSLC